MKTIMLRQPEVLYENFEKKLILAAENSCKEKLKP